VLSELRSSNARNSCSTSITSVVFGASARTNSINTEGRALSLNETDLLSIHWVSDVLEQCTKVHVPAEYLIAVTWSGCVAHGLPSSLTYTPESGLVSMRSLLSIECSRRARTLTTVIVAAHCAATFSITSLFVEYNTFTSHSLVVGAREERVVGSGRTFDQVETTSCCRAART